MADGLYITNSVDSSSYMLCVIAGIGLIEYSGLNCHDGYCKLQY